MACVIMRCLRCKKNISDEALIKAWTQGEAKGLSEPQMYLYLIAMLKHYNPGEMPGKIEELKKLSKGRSFEQNVKNNLKKLGVD